ncbi:MAG: amidohydrolase family protein [Candidatus Izemoplasmatales bacterium]
MDDMRIQNGMVYRNGHFEATNIYVKAGLIVRIDSGLFPARDIIDASNKLVLPGFIDPHVHFALNLGKFHSADDFYSGSIAAAYGGVTTFIDFLDPTDCVNDLELAYERRLKEAQTSVVDYQFHATIKNPKGDLEPFVKKVLELGMTSIKLFTTYSNSGRRTNDLQIRELLRLSQKYGVLITAHIENDAMIRINNTDTFRDLSSSRPSDSETSEALKLARFVRETGGKLYMVHLSSGETLKQLKSEYPDLLNKQFFIESCPQYFFLNNERFLQQDGYLYTMAPPIRSAKEQEILNNLINDVFTIGTDHCPFMKAEKSHTLLNDIPLGIGGVEHAFDLMYHAFSHQIIDKMTKNSANIHRLAPQKGQITLGSDADLVIYKAEKDSHIISNHSRCDYDVYHDFPRDGVVESTLVRGQFVIRDQQFVSGNGQLVKRR